MYVEAFLALRGFQIYGDEIGYVLLGISVIGGIALAGCFIYSWILGRK